MVPVRHFMCYFDSRPTVTNPAGRETVERLSSGYVRARLHERSETAGHCPPLSHPPRLDQKTAAAKEGCTKSPLHRITPLKITFQPWRRLRVRVALQARRHKYCRCSSDVSFSSFSAGRSVRSPPARTRTRTRRLWKHAEDARLHQSFL